MANHAILRERSFFILFWLLNHFENSYLFNSAVCAYRTSGWHFDFSMELGERGPSQQVRKCVIRTSISLLAARLTTRLRQILGNSMRRIFFCFRLGFRDCLFNFFRLFAKQFLQLYFFLLIWFYCYVFFSLVLDDTCRVDLRFSQYKTFFFSSWTISTTISAPHI